MQPIDNPDSDVDCFSAPIGVRVGGTQTPELSVVIPTFNEKDRLPLTFEIAFPAGMDCSPLVISPKLSQLQTS
jgi:hypothetical protein